MLRMGGSTIFAVMINKYVIAAVGLTSGEAAFGITLTGYSVKSSSFPLQIFYNCLFYQNQKTEAVLHMKLHSSCIHGMLYLLMY